MKKIFANKWVKIGLFSALALFLVFGIAIPYIDSVKWNTQHDIEQAVYEIFTFPDVSDMDRARNYMETVKKSEKNREEFETQAIKEISKFDSSFHAVIYDLTAQQIMLEELDYESPKIKEAQEKQIRDAFEIYSKQMDMDDFVRDVLKESSYDDKIYGTELTYYVSPQTILVDEFLPAYFAEKKDAAFTSRKTAQILSLFNDLDLVEEFNVIEINDVLSVEDALAILTDGAEEIIVKPDAGGYYDGAKDESDSDFEKDELFGAVVNDLLGLEGEATKGQVSTVEFFGDLASCFYTQTLHYQGTDSNGGSHSTTQDSNTRRSVLLKGVRINEHYTVNEKHIKYAYEDGMVSYHKDGHCFAISDNALTCFVGKHSFLFEF